MKSAFATIIVVVLSATVAFAELQKATLTLKGDNVILETKTKIIKYPITKVPGFSTIKFEPKVSIQDDKEINISEVTFENKSDWEKLVLIESKPTKVIWDAQTSAWRPAPEK